jgi:NifU-like protein involved in Fe-S cluster formation
VRLALRLADGRIADARFKGDSCAICMAAADLLVEAIRGRAVADAQALGPDDLLTRLGARIRPSRMTCVTLPLQVLRGALAAVGAAR